MDAGPAGEHDQGEGEGHGDAEAQLQHLDEVGVLEVGEDIPAHIRVVEGHIAEEADGDVDGGADVHGALHHLRHLGGRGVGEAGVHLEDVGLTRQRHGEDGEALQHAAGPPEVDLGHPEAGLDLGAGLEDDPQHDEAVEADAGGADVLQALDVPDQGERQGHEQPEGGEDDQAQVGVVLHLREVRDDRGSEISHHHEEGDGGPHQVADDPQLYEQLPRGAERVKRQVFKVSPSGEESRFK